MFLKPNKGGSKMDVTDQFQRDAMRVPTQDELTQLTETISALYESEAMIKDLEAVTKELKDRVQKIKREHIPTLMSDAGMAEFTTSTGLKVEIEDKIHASIAEKNMFSAIQWLIGNNLGHVIKRKFSLTYGMDEIEEQEKVKEVLDSNSFQYEDKPSVAPSTLKKLVRECRETGLDIPIKVFGIYEYTEAKIVKKEVSTQFASILRAEISPTEEMSASVDKLGYSSAEQLIKTEGIVEGLRKLTTTQK
jgi:hypothetical protein